MQISSFRLNLADFGAALSIRAPRRAGAVATTGAGTAAAGGPSLRDLQAATGRLRDSVDALQGALGIRRTGVGTRPAVAQATTTLGLSTTATATRLVSTQEVNTTPSSFTPRGPSFTGSSTAQATVGGVYDGDQGDDALTFRVTTGGILGLTPVQIAVVRSDNQTVQTLTFGFGYQADTPVALQNGLTLSLGSGSLAFGDTFQVDVSVTTGSAVDPTKPFDGTRNSDPNFEPGLSVHAGSFTINGTSIGVLAADSIDTVLARINASAAGVTATFDAASETIALEQNTPGSAATIALGADSSGFLAATKLAGATATAGTDDERTRPIAQVAALAGVRTGTFAVNGQQVALDVLTDSLADVFARIAAAAPGVTASFDASSRRVSVRASGRDALALDSGDTDLFGQLGLADGEFAARTGSSRTRAQDPGELRRRLDDFGRALDDLFDARFAGAVGPAADFARAKVRGAIAGAFADVAGASGATLSAHGIDIEFGRKDGKVFRTDRTRLDRALSRDAGDLTTLLGRRNDGERGVVERLADVLDRLDGDLQRFFGATIGSRVDFLA